jgi:D-alanyl-D-alanine carboxypeptidase
MKTGFICASGFNVVASASRGSKRFIAVVLGARSSAQRAEKAAQLLEKGFSGAGGLSWLMPALGRVEGLTPVKVDPPNLRDEMCGKHRRRPAAESSEEEDEADGLPDGGSIWTLLNPGLEKAGKGGPLLGPLVASAPPVPVFVGPAKGATAIARNSKGNAYRTAAAQPATAPDAGTSHAPMDAASGAFGDFAKILSASRFTPNNSGALALTSSAEAASAPVVRPDNLVPLPRPRPRMARQAAAPRTGGPTSAATAATPRR